MRIDASCYTKVRVGGIRPSIPETVTLLSPGRGFAVGAPICNAALKYKSMYFWPLRPLNELRSRN